MATIFVLIRRSDSNSSDLFALQEDHVFSFLVYEKNVPEHIVEYVLAHGLCYFRQDGYITRLLVSHDNPAEKRKQQVAPARVTDYLYLSDADFAENDEWRAKRGITHIVHAMPTCRCCPNLYPQKGLVHKVNENNLRVCLHDSDIFDNKDVRNVVQPVINFIDHARKSHPRARVLVHCAAGVSRSATLVLAYLIAREHMTLRDAVSHVFSKRPIIDPIWLYIQTLFEVEEGRIVPINV